MGSPDRGTMAVHQAAPLAQDRSTSSACAQLFARMSQEIEDAHPPNVIHFIVDFLCKNYPEHLHGFASIWNADPDLERERQEVCRFFKHHKISTQIAAHFTNAGYDTLETLATLHTENLADIEAFNNVKWLPGHKVRLQHLFADIERFVQQHRAGLGYAGMPGQPVMIPGQQMAPMSMPPMSMPTSAAYGSPSLSVQPSYPSTMGGARPAFTSAPAGGVPMSMAPGGMAPATLAPSLGAGGRATAPFR